MDFPALYIFAIISLGICQQFFSFLMKNRGFWILASKRPSFAIKIQVQMLLLLGKHTDDSQIVVWLWRWISSTLRCQMMKNGSAIKKGGF